MAKVPLATVLWEAANKYLPIEDYSCHATAHAMHGKRWRHSAWRSDKATRFLKSLGCDHESAGFKGIHDEDEASGTRYMWLLLAMHAAADEEIMVEKH
jgi:hypothetical protein